MRVQSIWGIIICDENHYDFYMSLGRGSRSCANQGWEPEVHSCDRQALIAMARSASAACGADPVISGLPVQSKRNKRAILKLMRKLLKKYASLLSGWSPMTCADTAPQLGIEAGMNAGDRRTIELQIRINQRRGGNTKCSGSSRGQPKNFFPRMPPSTTLSAPTRLMSAGTHRALRARGDGCVADGSRSGQTIREAPTLHGPDTVT